MVHTIIFDIDSLIIQPNLSRESFSLYDDITIIHSPPQKLLDFISVNQDCCCIITQYPLESIMPIMEMIECDGRCISSSLLTEDGTIIPRSINKSDILGSSTGPVVLVTGNTYSPDFIALADFIIAFGKNERGLSTELLMLSTHAIYDEEKLCQILQQLL